MLVKFSLESLVSLDAGRIRETVDQAIKRCFDDCEDRPAHDAARRVSIELSIVPVVAGEGRLDSCDVFVDVKERIPARKSKRYNAQVRRDGVYFNEASPDDADQLTLDEIDEGDGSDRPAGKKLRISDAG